MSRNILVITSSGRKKGNTAKMADAFISQAQAKGHTVNRVDTAFGNFKGCMDCKQCFKHGKACVFDDDFSKIAPLIEAADTIVYVMPVYWFSMPATIKAVIDKMWSFVIAEKNIAGKDAALLSCAEEPDMSVFDGVRIPYEKSLKYLQWNNIGEVLIPSAFELDAIDKTSGLVKARALANRL